MRSIYGHRAKQLALAFGQSPEGMALAELSRALAVPASSAQRALQSLAAERLLASSGRGRARRYRLRTGLPATGALEEFALHSLPAAEAVAVICRANPAVEFAGCDRAGLLLILSPFAQPADVVRVQRALASVVGQANIEMLDRSDLRRRLRDDAELLARGRKMEVIKGLAARTFRDPHDHGSFTARPLGRLHQSLKRPGQDRIRELARRNGLARLSVFGSAAREDFRPDSDVDVLVEAAPGERTSLANLADVQRELESMFDRDVDVVTVGSLPREMLERVGRDEVVLYG